MVSFTQPQITDQLLFNIHFFRNQFYHTSYPVVNTINQDSIVELKTRFCL